MQAYQLEQGVLAKWCTQGTDRPPPTAVLVHGILGSKRNLKTFTRMLLQVGTLVTRDASSRPQSHFFVRLPF
jgi:dienelactone hydrolase